MNITIIGLWKRFKMLGTKKIYVCKIKAPPKLGPGSLVKIGSVTPKIQTVARTNVTWTNVTVTIRICSRCSQESTFKVWSKLGQ